MTDAARLRRAPARSLRGRLTLLTAVVVTVPLLLAVLVLGTVVHRVVTASLAEDAAAESQRVAGLVSALGPALVSAPDGAGTGYRVQVVDAAGRVVASSTPDARPFADVAPAPGTTGVVGADRWWTPWSGAGDDLVAATTTLVLGEPATVLVAVSQEAAARSVNALTGTLTAMVPLLVAAAAATTWIVVGRTLGRVEAVRRRVDEIGGDAASAGLRVPVPATRDEIHDLAVTMNDLLDRIERSRAAQRAFVADAGHELRSPVSTLSAALELADDDPAEWSALAPLARTETRRMRTLVDDLLTLSRIDDGRLVLDRVDVDLDELARSEAARARAAGGPEVRVDAAPARLRGDRDRLETVVRNLVDNARRHARSTILLRTAPATDAAADDRVELRVEDDGPGVPPDDRARVFERFVRLDDARSRDAGGSGLGLAIVADLVRAHGGMVRVEGSAELGGAAVVVRLPTTPDGPPAPVDGQAGSPSR